MHYFLHAIVDIFRYYTSLTLVEWLLALDITSIGTVNSERKGLKVLCSKDSDRDTPSSIFYQLDDNEQITATSYMTKTKSGRRRNTVVLSSHPQIYRVTDDDIKKPAIIKVYDFTKGIVMLSYYTFLSKVQYPFLHFNSSNRIILIIDSIKHCTCETRQGHYIMQHTCALCIYIITS